MATGISLHIGLNFVDPNAYDGWDGELAGCINDANDMMALARNLNFNTSQLIDSQATSAKVIDKIAAAADVLQAGDLFFISYSGHGGQIPDEQGQESDGYNETWVLYDRELLDNELYCLWERFQPNVRIVVISDSCHSGTVVRKLLRDRRKGRPTPIIGQDGTINKTQEVSAVIQDIENKVLEYQGMHKVGKRNKVGISDNTRLRFMPFIENMKDYYQNKDLYSVVRTLSGAKSQNPIKANLILISGCQDNQLSSDGDANGLFTGTLLRTWENGNFTGSYRNFHEAILTQMPLYQTPNFLMLGPDATRFDHHPPFKINTGIDSNNPTATPSTPEIDPEDPNPKISGPNSWSRNGAAPVFNIHKGQNPYYYVEVCTRNQLFNYASYGSQRNTGNFFATWNDAQFPNNGRLTASSFQLPAYAWNAFKNGERLYFRIGTTSSLNSWDNFMITFADLDYLNAPFTVLTNGTEQPETPTNPGNTSSTNVISDSVGQGGDNARQNVRVIQALLNNISNSVGGPSPKLVIDGWYGENTLNAIKKFQDYHSITSNYGLIRPNGNSLQRLVNAQPAASLTLTGNVGENESNIFTDVRSLQSALNAVSSQAGGPAQKLVTDGLFGQRTLAAIKKFQDTYYTGNDPYGLVTPDGRTLAILNTFV